MEEHGVKYVVVVDIDEFIWNEQQNRRLKDLVVGALAHSHQCASQLSCHFHHFGPYTNKHKNQTKPYFCWGSPYNYNDIPYNSRKTTELC
jgi:hypothetical protein